MSGTSWRDPANLLALAALTSSVVAVGISVHSCRASDAAYVHAVKEADARRRLLVEIAEPDTEQRRRWFVRFESASPEWSLQTLAVTFPPELGISPVKLAPPFEMRSTTGADWLQPVLKAIANDLPVESAAYPATMTVRLPVLLEANYVYVGEPNDTLSVYDFIIVINYSARGEPIAVLKRSLLRTHLANKDMALKSLDALWRRKPYEWARDEDSF